eukprot:763553-Hanusia_phi.AAC.1
MNAAITTVGEQSGVGRERETTNRQNSCNMDDEVDEGRCSEGEQSLVTCTKLHTQVTQVSGARALDDVYPLTSCMAGKGRTSLSSPCKADKLVAFWS